MSGNFRSSLARHAGSMRDPDPDGLRHFAADLFRNTGMIVIDPDWITSSLDRDFVKVTAGTAFKGWGRKR